MTLFNLTPRAANTTVTERTPLLTESTPSSPSSSTSGVSAQASDKRSANPILDNASQTQNSVSRLTEVKVTNFEATGSTVRSGREIKLVAKNYISEPERLLQDRPGYTVQVGRPIDPAGVPMLARDVKSLKDFETLTNQQKAITNLKVPTFGVTARDIANSNDLLNIHRKFHRQADTLIQEPPKDAYSKKTD